MGAACIWAGVLGMGIGGGICPLEKGLGLDFFYFYFFKFGEECLTVRRSKPR